MPQVPAAPAVPRADVAQAQPLPVTAVRLLESGTLGAWQTRNAEATIPHCLTQLEASGVLDNYRRLTGELDPEVVPYRGFVFADSDLHKVIEAVAWEIGRSGTHAFDGWLDDVIRLLARAQQPDGYLMSAIQSGRFGERWENLEHHHELYVLGHLVQAAVALDRCAGRDDLMQIATRFVELVDATFGPDGERAGICGHPEIETALIELYRHTGERRHLALAQHMLDLRGTGLLPVGWAGREYYQDHAPVRSATAVAGHAVRQLYLDAGVTDAYLETGERALLDAMHAQWHDAHDRKMYISGAFGSRHRDEAFGCAYELPPDRAYAETCATIADLHWSWRMYLAAGGSRYGDVIERELHNALAASLDATGTRFFYSNPLQSRPDKHSEDNAPRERTPWYPCACCPPNIARAIAQLGAYVASVTEEEIAIHQYADADVTLPAHLGGGTLRVRTDYPANGVVVLSLDGEAPAGTWLALRVPGWAPSTTIDGVGADEDGYLRVALADAVESQVRLVLDIAPRWTRAHPHLDAVRGCVVLEAGPVVHAVEQTDLPDGVALDDLRVRLDGVERTTEGLQVTAVVAESPSSLYGPVGTVPAQERPVSVTAIPFADWGNRGAGAMKVWLPADA